MMGGRSLISSSPPVVNLKFRTINNVVIPSLGSKEYIRSYLKGFSPTWRISESFNLEMLSLEQPLESMIRVVIQFESRG